jgi:hypothetical protein
METHWGIDDEKEAHWGIDEEMEAQWGNEDQCVTQAKQARTQRSSPHHGAANASHH